MAGFRGHGGMMPAPAPEFSRENPLHVSWYDSAWIPILNQSNVMDYFSERSNPFYDRTSNNEVCKMQRFSPEHLANMQGVEYVLLHVQEPILYVVRKQHRHSPTQVTPLADYYILTGVVYQAPDLCSVINSRLLNAVHCLKGVFDESLSYARYHQSKGYWWEFKNKQPEPTVAKSKEDPNAKKKKEEPSSLFQRQRVDVLLAELAKKFPQKVPTAATQQPVNVHDQKPLDAKLESLKDVVKTEKRGSDHGSVSSGPTAMKPPPEKKPKLIR